MAEARKMHVLCKTLHQWRRCTAETCCTADFRFVILNPQALYSLACTQSYHCHHVCFLHVLLRAGHK